MKLNLFPTLMLAAFSAVGFLSLSSCASSSLSAPASSPSPPESMDVFHAVNNYRVSVGSSRLLRHAGLDRLAQQHSEYLLKNRGSFGLYGGNVSHFGFEGRAVYSQRFYKIQNLGENVASCNGPGDRSGHLVQMWKDSPEHHHNMKQSWSVTGIGYAKAADGQIFCTQLFGSLPFTSAMDTRERYSLH